MKQLFLWLGFLIFLASSSHSAVEVRSSLPWLKSLGSVAECVIANDEFRKEVSAIPKFDFTTRTGPQVVSDLREVNGVVVSTYKTKYKYSKTIAYRPVGKKEIYFNLRKNPRDYESMINTMIHEMLHVAGYGHGDNSSRGKQNAVPYKVGKISEKYVSICAKGMNL